MTCSRTGEERAGKTRGGVKGKKLLPLLLLLTLFPFHQHTTVCMALEAGGGLGNAWALQFPSMPGCLCLRMQAKETGPCSERGVTPRRH